MKQEIIILMFDMLTPKQKNDIVTELMENFVLRESEVCKLFGLTDTELQIILSYDN